MQQRVKFRSGILSTFKVASGFLIGDMESKTYSINCMEYMRSVPDKFFDLAVVAPPYGLGGTTVSGSQSNGAEKERLHKNRVNKSRHSGSGTLKNRVLNRTAEKFEKWDIAPTQEYFEELFRVSRNQIIWGGNYFPLPPTRCVICWDKLQPWENFSQVEIAWTSFDLPAKLFRYDNRYGGKIHATQKPVALYAWIYRNFAKPGDKILDTHLGSGSSRIAAYRAGLDFYGCEIDREYFEAEEERFARECLGVERVGDRTITQLSLFDG